MVLTPRDNLQTYLSLHVELVVAVLRYKRVFRSERNSNRILNQTSPLQPYLLLNSSLRYSSQHIFDRSRTLPL